MPPESTLPYNAAKCKTAHSALSETLCPVSLSQPGSHAADAPEADKTISFHGHMHTHFPAVSPALDVRYRRLLRDTVLCGVPWQNCTPAFPAPLPAPTSALSGQPRRANSSRKHQTNWNTERVQSLQYPPSSVPEFSFSKKASLSRTAVSESYNLMTTPAPAVLLS